jgi:hypothetical protein
VEVLGQLDTLGTWDVRGDPASLVDRFDRVTLVWITNVGAWITDRMWRTSVSRYMRSAARASPGLIE